jgi:hypothetical protein
LPKPRVVKVEPGVVKFLYELLPGAPQWHYRAVHVTSRRLALACLLAVLAALAGNTAALAGPRDVVADYWVDGELDGHYTIAELRGALKEPAVTRGGGAYDALVDLVNAEITSRLVGGRDRETAGAPRPARQGEKRSAEVGIPRPARRPAAAPPDPALPADVPVAPTTVRRGEVPTPFVVLAAASGLLLLGGAGTALYRRLRH